MNMDEGQLAAETARLVEIFADRVPDEELDGLREMARGGEWDELLDLLMAVLTQTGAAVSRSERDQLRAVLAGWGLPAGQVDELG
jgi:hypothetical protein